MSAPTAVLYDVPGPKARARNGALGVVAVIVVAALLAFVVVRLIATGQFEGRVWEWILYENIQLALLEGLLNTLRAFAVGAVLALAFGAVFALGRLSDHAWVRGLSTAVVEFFRAVPLVVLMFIFYFGMPSVGVTVSTFTAVVVALTLYNGSVLAEIFRSGVQAVPRGQSEAAYALGMRKSAVMRFVLLPQAVRSMLPTIVSQLVVLLKDSALGFLILYPELLYQARVLGSSGQLGRPLLPVAFVVALAYITLCLLLTALAGYLERRTRRVAPAPAVVDEGA
ncbi:amino acid ABC transporter permease [Actinomycetospora sp. NBRC 106378]|uniref:amino acid ABC transporter permease n=1 Tax=Actinomycetospora sp. NBRC 106378 TaxID=3032208 RepID=UPI0024A00851|nr:amino acid ABC transporter permease [Actinomycetospora sp. NBRC 106378]GLZ55809.1 amino acid ABC transporter permease [Actinomycetospora sp. NBRC 106378]